MGNGKEQGAIQAGNPADRLAAVHSMSLCLASRPAAVTCLSQGKRLSALRQIKQESQAALIFSRIHAGLLCLPEIILEIRFLYGQRQRI